jgi:hypothetical protein
MALAIGGMVVELKCSRRTVTAFIPNYDAKSICSTEKLDIAGHADTPHFAAAQ